MTWTTTRPLRTTTGATIAIVLSKDETMNYRLQTRSFSQNGYGPLNIDEDMSAIPHRYSLDIVLPSFLGCEMKLLTISVAPQHAETLRFIYYFVV